MPGRVLDRKKRRLPCELRSAGQKWAGMVLDVSASGIFVQTSAKVRPGAALEMEVSVPGSPEPVLMSVEVVRIKNVPPQLRAVAQGGIGVRITSAPEAYYRFMQQLEGMNASEAEVADPVPSYQVRVKQTTGPRTKRLFVDACDEDAAREAAVKQLGDGWQILDVSPA